MGAWGTGIFENDQVQDGLADLFEAERPVDIVREAIALAEDDYIEVDPGSSIIAAAVLVDHLIYGTEYAMYAEDFTRMREEHTATEFEPLRKELSAALAKAISPDSELYELWQEAGDGSLNAWRKPLRPIRDRLAGLYKGSQ